MRSLARSLATFLTAALALALPMRASAAEPQGTKSLEEIMRGLLDTDGTSRGMGSVANEPKAPPPPGQARIAVPIQFEYNSAAVSPASRDQLEIIAKALDSAELKSFRIGIEGHTDQSGSADYNLRLSEARAQAVKRYLVEKLGVSGTRLEAHGYGKGRPLAGVSQDTDEGRALNRRVELVNLGRKGDGAAAPAAAKLETKAKKPTVRVAVHYRKSGDVQVLKPGGTLESNDSYRVSFVADQDAHVYLYQIDSSGKAQTLFPNAELSPAANPVRASQSVDLPPEGKWLTLDANRGEEQIVAVASAKELADPKALALDQWNSVASGASRGVAAAPRPGYQADPGDDVFLDRFPFQHK